MPKIITDPKLYYKFDASVLWNNVSPELGVHLRLAEEVRASMVIYNKAYPPPPPGWTSALGTVIFVGACCAVLGAVVLSSGGVITGATSAQSVSTTVASGVNGAASSAAAAAGTTVPAAATVSTSTASTFATSATTYAGAATKVIGGVSAVAKAIGTEEGKDIATKMDAIAGVIDGDESFTDGVVKLYKQEMQKKNLKIQEEQRLRELAKSQQNQYSEYLKNVAKNISPFEEKIQKYAIPAVGVGILGYKFFT